MTEASPSFRKKQAVLCILVFACIVVAFMFPTPTVAVGAILVACLFCFLAAKIQPETEDEHHHH
jgi:uncharacterized membrane protein YbaN (DUF454 family)